MNSSLARALASRLRGVDCGGTTGLETTETALRMPRSRRVPVRIARLWLLPLASYALCGLATLPVRADDQPAQPAPVDKPAKPADQDKAAKPAQPTSADKSAIKVAQATPAPTTAAQPPAAQPPATPAQPPATPAAPAAPPPPAPGSVSITGLVDVYYGINFRAPHAPGGGPFAAIPTTDTKPVGVDNVGRAFDINDREPSLSLGELNISRTPGKGFPLGITATLTVGDTAKIVHGNEYGGTSSWEYIQQLYLTYTPHVWGRDISIDFGEFVTPFGQEVIESSSNDNYSRSLGFLDAIPFYHSGLRFGIPLTPKLQATLEAVQGWNTIANSNGSGGGIGQLAWTATPQVTLTATGYFGSDGTGAYGPALLKNSFINTGLGEFIAVYNPTPKLKLAGIVDYGSGAGTAKTSGGPGIVTASHVSGTWLSYGAYARYQIAPQWAVAARVDQIEDVAGAGGAGLKLGLAIPYDKIEEGTFTLEYVAMHGHLVSRLEYRHDNDDHLGIFGAGSRGVGDQDTVYLGEVYKF